MPKRPRHTEGDTSSRLPHLSSSSRKHQQASYAPVEEIVINDEEGPTVLHVKEEAAAVDEDVVLLVDSLTPAPALATDNNDSGVTVCGGTALLDGEGRSPVKIKKGGNEGSEGEVVGVGSAAGAVEGQVVHWVLHDLLPVHVKHIAFLLANTDIPVLGGEDCRAGTGAGVTTGRHHQQFSDDGRGGGGEIKRRTLAPRELALDILHRVALRVQAVTDRLRTFAHESERKALERHQYFVEPFFVVAGLRRDICDDNDSSNSKGNCRSVQCDYSLVHQSPEGGWKNNIGGQVLCLTALSPSTVSGMSGKEKSQVAEELAQHALERYYRGVDRSMDYGAVESAVQSTLQSILVPRQPEGSLGDDRSKESLSLDTNRSRNALAELMAWRVAVLAAPFSWSPRIVVPPVGASALTGTGRCRQHESGSGARLPVLPSAAGGQGPTSTGTGEARAAPAGGEGKEGGGKGKGKEDHTHHPPPVVVKERTSKGKEYSVIVIE